MGKEWARENDELIYSERNSIMKNSEDILYFTSSNNTIDIVMLNKVNTAYSLHTHAEHYTMGIIVEGEIIVETDTDKYVCRCFKKIVGMTPASYQKVARISKEHFKNGLTVEDAEKISNACSEIYSNDYDIPTQNGNNVCYISDKN